MTGEPNIEDFTEMGIVRGSDGKEYSIRVNNDLPLGRKAEIFKRVALQSLDIEGHVFVPDGHRGRSLLRTTSLVKFLKGETPAVGRQFFLPKKRGA